MTATNHALTGAVIAVSLKQPALVLPLAFLSHFVLDALPHFGIHEDDVIRRNKHPLFRSVVTADVVVAVSLLLGLPLLVHGLAWWLLDLAMLAAILPDSIWIGRFLQEVRLQQPLPSGRYARWHQKIQWSEKPWGIAVEIVWAAVMFTTTLIT